MRLRNGLLAIAGALMLGAVALPAQASPALNQGLVKLQDAPTVEKAHYYHRRRYRHRHHHYRPYLGIAPGIGLYFGGGHRRWHGHHYHRRHHFHGHHYHRHHHHGFRRHW